MCHLKLSGRKYLRISWLLLLLFAEFACAAPAKILLTFDDGPQPENTMMVLDELSKRNAKAVFFILTGPETLFRNMPFKMVFPKAETEEGLQTLVDEASQGHLLACHWGGSYQAQSRFHPRRMNEPAYDATGDGVIDRVSMPGNALESDLIQCRQRLNQALQASHDPRNGGRQQAPGDIKYIRPPIWKYKNRHHDARVVYAALGMQMVLTDFKLGDGGMRFQGVPGPGRMAKNTAKAILNGQTEVVLTLHDSNSRTARRLSGTLDKLESKLLRFGLVRGVDWQYTSNLSEINQVLKNFVDRQNKKLEPRREGAAD